MRLFVDTAGTLAGAAVCMAALASLAPTAPTDPMQDIARRYVELVLSVGQHDDGYVDAYYGPPEWKTAAAARKASIATLQQEAAALRAEVQVLPRPDDQLARLRVAYLDAQLRAVSGRLQMLAGRKFPFDEESQILYDAVAPTHPAAYFDEALKQLDGELPGHGSVQERYEAYRQAFVIPTDRLSAVFDTALAECRGRTKRHIPLPGDESFTIEYVTDKPWSGYNWYQGHATSLIQVNTELPIYIDRAVDLACHEGYPGHHVYNVLLEQHLVRDRGWMEFTVYPLFSPQSLIAEGTANFGIDVAFPGQERVAFERDKLFPAAGLDPSGAARYYAVAAIVDRLSYAGNEAARRYLNGEIDRAAAARWLEHYALMSPKRAEQRVRFFDTYRSYVINYNLGKDLVRAYIERRGGAADQPERRWSEFAELLSSPRLPSGLREVDR
jgi:hypothetical protein